MKSTGVIRRIDELGRIVIPKEIRRNLGIRDGENVEIFTESDSIILKKYNRITSTSELAKNLAEIINNEFAYKMIVTDREKVIAVSGLNNELLNKKLTKEQIGIIDKREIIEKQDYKLILEEIELTGNILYIPVISLNDSIGLIIMYNEKNFTNELSIGKLVSSIFAKKLDI